MGIPFYHPPPVFQPPVRDLPEQVIPADTDEPNPVTLDVLDRLGPFLQADDGSLASFVDAQCGPLRKPDQYSRDGKNGEPGWSILLDLERVPIEAVAWLAQFVGATVAPQSASETDEVYLARAKNTIRNVPGWNRGTPAALAAAGRVTLTGNQFIILRERHPDPDSLTVITRASETPDRDATLAALLTQKVAGIKLIHSVLAGQDYETLFEGFATYGDVFTTYADYEDLVEDQP
jgi:hypothetical protein